ncbi:hypothetical protein AB4071_06885 [Stenotrophomonas sp. 2MCAF14_2]|uniref:hypothetical protein n=1 Tax=Stenotrophomonas sp. 2MCAF14_2 TaxID=3232983 RepID=UPI003F9B61FE
MRYTRDLGFNWQSSNFHPVLTEQGDRTIYGPEAQNYADECARDFREIVQPAAQQSVRGRNDGQAQRYSLGQFYLVFDVNEKSLILL